MNYGFYIIHYAKCMLNYRQMMYRLWTWSKPLESIIGDHAVFLSFPIFFSWYEFYRIYYVEVMC
jgi:hypothetical protein